VSPNRIASILTFLWTILQAWFLDALSYGPSGHPGGWLLCVVMAGVSVGLWFEKPWARMSALVIAAAFIVFYAAVAYVRSGVGCLDDSMPCYARTLSQPFIMAVTLVVLIWHPASNYRMERTREP
jgi:hypothetical protein